MSSEQTPERNLALQNLYKQAFPELWQAAYGQADLLPGDCDRLTTAVANLWGHYPGPDDDPSAFASWAICEVIRPAGERLRQFYGLKKQGGSAVRRGIASILAACLDLGATSDTQRDLEHLTWVIVLLDLDRWLAPGYSKKPGRPPATLNSRLYGEARLQALGWRKSQLRSRAKLTNMAASDRHIVAVECDGAYLKNEPTESELKRIVSMIHEQPGIEVEKLASDLGMPESDLLKVLATGKKFVRREGSGIEGDPIRLYPRIGRKRRVKQSNL